MDGGRTTGRREADGRVPQEAPRRDAAVYGPGGPPEGAILASLHPAPLPSHLSPFFAGHRGQQGAPAKD